MANLALGIDTGGTFTDGVIFDLENNEIIKKTKEITTRHNLKIAIGNCLNSLIDDKTEKDTLNDIKMVSLSTTLATNAIVEGQGAEVGLILIGFNSDKDFPTPYYQTVAGGCDVKGEIKEEINQEEIYKVINEMKDKVDAFAVSGYMSIRNPEQENKVAKIIREKTGYPVVAAHQLTSDLGIRERTVTAVFNARLLPLITELIETVQEKIKEKGLDAPLMVVRGDGSLISDKVAREKPVETSLSGPAASIMGAMALTGVENGMVVDMGGTTTDVAILIDGKPNLSSKGASVGGWLTRVKAADITTEGIGGDSIIKVSKQRVLSIGPQRVFPLSWVVSKYPHLYEELQEIYESKFFPLGSQPTNILVYIKDPVNFDLSRSEKDLLKAVKEKPHTLYHTSQKIDMDVEMMPWQRLVNAGSLHRASLTPTDILHYLEEYNNWNKEAADLGIKIMSERYDQEEEKFVKNVLEKIYNKIAVLLINVLINNEGGEISLKEKTASYLFKKMLAQEEKENGSLIKFDTQIKVPILAVGAPVKAYFKQIAEKLNADLYLPESAEVANAVGTVSGKIIEKVEVFIKPGKGGGFIVHTPEERKSFIKYNKAVDYGREKGEKFALKQASYAGAFDIEVFINQEDKYSKLPGQLDEDENKLFIESKLNISAVGKPW